MNLQFSTKLLAIAIASLSLNTFVRSGSAETTYMTDRINFYCGKFTDKYSGETIPATMAYVPQRKASVSVIAWKSDYIPAWDAQTRCDTVSPKFQTFYEDSRLDYLTTGVNNGYDIVCAAVEKQPCQADDQLFQVTASDDPQAVLKGLTGIIGGKSSEPIYQSSGQQIYVSMDKLLDAAPTVESASK